jgi:Mg2+/Co2+ transporter CorC
VVVDIITTGIIIRVEAMEAVDLTGIITRVNTEISSNAVDMVGIMIITVCKAVPHTPVVVVVDTRMRTMERASRRDLVFSRVSISSPSDCRVPLRMSRELEVDGLPPDPLDRVGVEIGSRIIKSVE